MVWRLAELAVRFGCELQGDPDVRIDHVATLQAAGANAISFLANPRYRKFLGDTRAGAVILEPKWAADCPVSALLSENPYTLYAKVAGLLHPEADFTPGVAASASVAPTVEVPLSAHVGPAAVVESGSEIGERVYIGPGCVVGAGARIGEDSRLVANVTVCRGVQIGRRVLLHPGAVIGADGFGLAREGRRWIKVPQLGTVEIGDDVEIGANTTVDRGAVGDTVIEDGVKLDNQIQVAHNVRIGAHTVIAGCTGISGSTVIGRHCMIAGAVGIAGHLTIADEVVITGMTMVSHSISQAGVYSGSLPMDEATRWRRNSARFRRLDELAKRVARLESGKDRTSDEDATDE